MKRIIAVVAVLGLFFGARNAFSAELISQTRDVNGFDRIEVRGAYDLYLTQGAKYELRIEAEPEIMERLTSEVKNGCLVLSERENRIKIGIFKSHKRKAFVTLPELKELQIKGASDVNGQNVLKTGNFQLIVSGAGDVDLVLEAKDVDVKISGAGDIRLKGSAENVSVSITGSGDINAYGLTSKKASVAISGAGDCKVNAEQELTVNIAGTGDVSYAGSPKVAMKKITGTGRVSKK
jgi:hypothetical protein